MARNIFTLLGRIRTEGFDTVQRQFTALDKSLTKMGNKFDKVGRDVTKVGVSLVKLTAPLAAVGVLAYKGVQAASDLNETIAKTGEIFGDSADQITLWASTSAEAFGQSQQQAMDAAATFGIFGKAAGLTGDNLAGFSTQFTELAADLASFNNTSPEDAITAIGAALRGENEPIRRYGVLLDDATMRQKALEMGITDSIKNALTPQQKTLAASALILEKTSDAQGDFARTSDGLANQMRIFKANVSDLSAEFGKIFLPIALGVSRALNDKLLPAVRGAVEWFSGLSPFVKDLIIGFSTFAVTIGPVLIAVGKTIQMLKVAITVFKTLNLVMAANPVGLIVTAIGLLILAGVLLVRNWDTVKTAFLKTWDTIVYGVQQAITFMKALFIDYLRGLVFGLQSVGKFIPGLNKVLQSAQDKLAEMRAAEELVWQSRKADREEAKLQAMQQKDLNDQTKKATEITKTYSAEMLKGVEIKKNDAKASEDAAKAAKKLAEDKAKFEDEYTAKLQQNTLSRGALLAIERQKALEEARQLGADRQLVEQFFKSERAKLDKEEAEERLANLKIVQDKRIADEEEFVSIMENSLATVFDLFSQYTDLKVERLDQELAADIDRVNKSKMNEADKQVAISNLEKKADAEKKKLQRDQAKRDKASAIFSAVISGFQSVAKALTLGFPLGIIAAVVMGALAAVQVGLIAAEPLPALAKGGLAKATPGGQNVTVAEAGQDELILPVSTGIRTIVDGVTAALAGVVLPPALPAALAGGGGGASASAGGGTILQVGTLIADDSGLRELDRRLYKFSVEEKQRKGLA